MGDGRPAVGVKCNEFVQTPVELGPVLVATSEEEEEEAMGTAEEPVTKDSWLAPARTRA